MILRNFRIRKYHLYGFPIKALAIVPCKSLIFVDINHLSQNFDRAV